MLSRDSKSDDSDIQKRPGFLFCRTIREVITLGAQYTKKSHNYLYDGLNETRMMLANLSTAFYLLEPKMRQEELKREEFQIPASLYRNIENLKTEANILNQQMQQLETDFETTQKTLSQEKFQLSENINNLKLQNSTQIENESEQQKLLLNQLQQQKNNLQQEVNAAQARLDGKCCHCFSCSITKEKKALDEAIGKLVAVENQIIEYQHPIKLQPNTAIAELETEKFEIESLLDKFINSDYPLQKKALQIKFEQIQASLIQAEEKLKLRLHINISSTNYLNISLYLRTYACLIEFKNCIDIAWRNKHGEDKEKIINNDLTKLKEVVTKLKSEADHFFESLWCPQSNDRSGKIIYDQFSNLDKKEQSDFIRGQFDEKFLMKILPHQIGVLLDDLNIDVSQLTHSTLFSINSNPTSTTQAEQNPKINPSHA